MSVTCPQGHQSEDPDWCSVCGAHLGDGAAAAPDPEPAIAPPEPAATTPCPVCGTRRLGDEQFCEECGHDFSAAAPVVETHATWRAVVEADRDQYDRNAPDDIAFPVELLERVIVLDRDCVHIGRRSAARRTHPEIDLAEPPEDTGVSRMHAELHRQADGSYALVDMGSVNGTTINGEATRLPEGESRPLQHGDRIHLGAWTRITIVRDPEPD